MRIWPKNLEDRLNTYYSQFHMVSRFEGALARQNAIPGLISPRFTSSRTGRANNSCGFQSVLNSDRIAMAMYSGSRTFCLYFSHSYLDLDLIVDTARLTLNVGHRLGHRMYYFVQYSEANSSKPPKSQFRKIAYSTPGVAQKKCAVR